ncbi:5468_t:CDS:2 [Racocetra persica]|uniref:5468_t:CDS:1 n=1 Tax=Racocetra persica TaxID=160502 RepID=A0ACA9KD98_9GLOM|nr:5468_t:CDS:2 [Racocetra persica]
MGIYFANHYDLYIDTDYQVEDLINPSEELELLETSYISNSNLQLTQYSDPTNITYLEDSSFSEESISYQLLISTSPPESVILNPNFSTPCESFGFETDQILDQIDIEANPTILEKDPDQNLGIIEEIYLEVKKGTEEILKIIIDMIEADLEIIIDMIEAGLEDTLLNNTSIREALANYLQSDSNIVNLMYSNRPRTIPVKNQTTIRNKLFTAIIDSRVAIIRLLDVIKDVSVEIAGITISIFIEVVLATTYSLILKNDWSRKKEEYEDEELIFHEAYTLKAESNNIEDSG